MSGAIVIAAGIVATSAAAAATSNAPPPVPAQPSDPAWTDWDEYFTGCSDWVPDGAGRWQFACGWQGETWIARNFYNWDPPSEGVVLYRTTYLDWMDMWGWDCFIPGQCNA
jgi:hypothetical protein